MRQYLAHFQKQADEFVGHVTHATNAWKQYSTVAVKREATQGELGWSAAYFLNAINAALISTRLFLSGFLVPSGNQARHSLESLAFGVLLPFPKTGTYREWKKGHAIEYKALEYLARNAEHCGVQKKNVEALIKQAKWFDHYSHPSRMALAAFWKPGTGGGWNVGALFAEDRLPQYRKEMANRISLVRLLTHTIAGTHAALIDRGMIDCPPELMVATRKPPHRRK